MCVCGVCVCVLWGGVCEKPIEGLRVETNLSKTEKFRRGAENIHKILYKRLFCDTF